MNGTPTSSGPFDVLGIAPTLDRTAIERAYFAALAHHPPSVRRSPTRLEPAEPPALAETDAPRSRPSCASTSTPLCIAWRRVFGSRPRRSERRREIANASAGRPGIISGEEASRTSDRPECYAASMPESAAAVRRWRSGQLAAEQRQRELVAATGPRPEQAVAEALAALDALEAMGLWPGPRDPASERAVDVVRQRWVRIQRRARERAGRSG